MRERGRVPGGTDQLSSRGEWLVPKSLCQVVEVLHIIDTPIPAPIPVQPARPPTCRHSHHTLSEALGGRMEEVDIKGHSREEAYRPSLSSARMGESSLA